MVDRLTESTHFIPFKSTYTEDYYANIYIDEIFSIHGISLSIISYEGAQFVCRLWISFKKLLGTRVQLSTVFQVQTDRQAERIIQTL